jgi:hypothetical protein
LRDFTPEARREANCRRVSWRYAKEHDAKDIFDSAERIAAKAGA